MEPIALALEWEGVDGRGCLPLVYLDTFSFQVPAFYLKLGYHLACELEGFPDGVSKLVLKKTLV